jgi:Flp pilus assembly protein TadB
MMMAGAGIGGVLFWLLLVVAPPAVSALVQLGRFDARATAPAATAPAATAGPAGWAGAARVQGRMGVWVSGQLRRHGIRYTSLRQDLALTGGSFEAVLGAKLAGFLAGFLLVAGTAAGLRMAGIGVPLSSPGLLAIGVGAGFFFLPDLEARREAQARRRDFRRALSAYLDLVALEMAGSAAPAEALPNAARVGAGWPLALLRDTLFRATLAGHDQWEALTELGNRIGVSELRDLGNLVQLVGRDGARVRATLTARAATMRRSDLADAEGQAGRRDQSMLMAQVLIGFGFIVFLGYPAVVSLMAL